MYVASPFQGSRDNVSMAERHIENLIKKYPELTYFSPIHNFGFLYESTEYLEGMELCFRALDDCDSILFLPKWEHSRGCQMEYGYARSLGIPIYEYDMDENKISIMRDGEV
jgi:nucleoside 2-deoxyribosyltransferase